MRDNKLIFWLALSALIVLLLNLPPRVADPLKSFVREAIAPLQVLVTGTWRSVREGVSSVRGYGGLLSENEQLSEQVILLQARVQDLKNLEAENNALRSLLDFRRRAERELIPCEIIGRDPDGWWQTLRLNRGGEDGISPDMAVISVDGLVGRTVSVSPHTADVLLLSDPTCRVAAQVTRTGSFGVLSGRGPTWRGEVVYRMDFINKNTPLAEGDEVVTSGLGGVFPSGLLIGHVDKVYADRSGLYQYADVIAHGDLGALQYVFVLKNTPVEALPPPTPAPGRRAR